MTKTAEAAWQKILADADAAAERLGTPLSESFAALVRVAHAESRLRQLCPWAGMWELHFSRCTESRYTRDVLYIGTLADGRFYVEGPNRDGPQTAETDNAHAAVRMVIEQLPPDCGPAFIGTTEELAAYEEARNRT